MTDVERIAREALAICAALLARMNTGQPLPPERLNEYSERVLQLYEQLEPGTRRTP